MVHESGSGTPPLVSRQNRDLALTKSFSRLDEEELERAILSSFHLAAGISDRFSIEVSNPDTVFQTTPLPNPSLDFY